MKINRTQRISLWAAWLVLGSIPATAPAQNSAFQVTNLKDNGPGSLRQAIASAEPGNTVSFAVTGTITLTNGELLITNDLSILGPGAALLTISDGTGSNRVLEVGTNASVALSGVTLANGHAPDGGTICYSPSHQTINGGSGGGIYNSGWLSLSGCVLAGNKAGNGSQCNSSGDCAGPAGNGGSGGGIFNSGTLTATGCVMSNNCA